MYQTDALLCIGVVLFMLIVLLSASTLHYCLTRRDKRQDLARNRGGGLADEYGNWERCPYNNPWR